MSTPSYIHLTDGRIRLKVAEIKKCPDLACTAESLLSEASGIESASANPLTGNILIYFDPEVTNHDEIIELLRQNGYLKRKAASRPALRLVRPNERAKSPSGQFDYKRYQKIAADAAIQTLIELAVKRAILALI